MDLYCKGDEEAFRVLYARYDSRLKSFIGRRLAGRHSASCTDLFQITWLKVHRARSQFSKDKKFSAWIFTIALNSIRDFISESHHLHEVGMDPTMMEPIASTESAQLKIDQVDMKTFGHALDSITPLQRDVVLLSDGEGFNSQELSKMLGISDVAVRQNLFRGRKRLRELLGANK